jgi:hypothetical protein
MMDKQHRSWYDRYGKRILIIFAVFFLWPIFIIFYIPVSWALKAYRQKKENEVLPHENVGKRRK